MGKLTVAEIKFYLQEAHSCEERQRRELFQRNNYPLLITYYEGLDKTDVTHPHVSAALRMAIINEYFPNTNALIAEIMYQNPDFTAEAAKPQAEDGEGLMKSALTYGMDKADALTENRVALFDMFYAGYSCIDVDHLTKETSKGQLNLVPDEKEMQEREQGGIVQKMVDKIRRKKADDEEKAEENLEKEAPPDEAAYGTNELTYIQRWDPVNVPLDWRAQRLKDRRYNLKKIWLSKAEFDARYPKFKDKVSADDHSEFQFSQHDRHLHTKRILLYEFQVKQRNNVFWTILISSTFHEEVIDMFKRPYTTNGFNMKIGTLHKYGQLYPIAMAQINKKMADEMNEYIRHQMEVAERNIPKRLVDRNKVKVDGLAALSSKKVNDNVLCNSIVNAVIPLPHTNVSVENKELFGLFQDQKNKLWSVQESRIGGKSVPKFAEELKIQTAGFVAKQIDIQEGLRIFIKEQLETFKDIIVVFWDFAIYLKITGGKKPTWYEPQIDPQTGNVLNPLTDLLTGDYSIKVDISTALRPNKEQKKQEAIAFISQAVLLEPLANAQGQTLNLEEIKKIAKDFGFSPENLYIPFQQPALPGVAPGTEGTAVSPVGVV